MQQHNFSLVSKATPWQRQSDSEEPAKKSSANTKWVIEVRISIQFTEGTERITFKMAAGME